MDAVLSPSGVVGTGAVSVASKNRCANPGTRYNLASTVRQFWYNELEAEATLLTTELVAIGVFELVELISDMLDGNLSNMGR